MKKYRFVWSNGKGIGYGNSVEHAVKNMAKKFKSGKKIETGFLIQIIESDKRVSYWDSRKFLEAFD